MSQNHTAEKTGITSTIVITVIGAALLFAGMYHLESQRTAEPTTQTIVK